MARRDGVEWGDDGIGQGDGGGTVDGRGGVGGVRGGLDGRAGVVTGRWDAGRRRLELAMEVGAAGMDGGGGGRDDEGKRRCAVGTGAGTPADGRRRLGLLRQPLAPLVLPLRRFLLPRFHPLTSLVSLRYPLRSSPLLILTFIFVIPPPPLSLSSIHLSSLFFLLASNRPSRSLSWPGGAAGFFSCR